MGRHRVNPMELPVMQPLRVTAADAFIRASIYFHYGKHLFANFPDQFRKAHESMLRCYMAGASTLDPSIERVQFPYKES